MADIVSTAGTVVATIVDLAFKQLRSIAGNPTTSFEDIHEELNNRLERLLALQRDIENEVLSDIQKDTSNVYMPWTNRVSNIGKEVASLNDKYEEVRGKKWHLRKKRRLEKEIKRALDDVAKLLEQYPEKILVDKPPDWGIREIGVPSIEEYSTLNKALQEIQALLKINGVNCVALYGQEGVGKTTIMQNLNNYVYDDKLFDMVIFIKVPSDEQTRDLHILQKIADRIRVDREGTEFEVAGRIKRVLEHKRYLLILDGVRHTIDGIWEKLDISKDKKDSKVVITTRYRLALKSKCVDKKVELKTLSLTEAWRMFREGKSSSKSTNDIGKLNLGQDVLRLMWIRDFLHLILSYPMRIGYEDFLNQWINNTYHLGDMELLSFADDNPDSDSLRRRVEHLISEIPLRYVQDLIPEDITKDIINGGSVRTETPLKHVPQPMLLLATHLALHQLILTLTSDAIPYSRLAIDKCQNIWFSTRNDAEKRTVVGNIQVNSRIREAFDDLQIIDLNQIDDQTQREQVLSNPATWLEETTSAESPMKNYVIRHLVLLVDGDGDKKLDPEKVSLPIKGDSEDVVVFITTLSSNDDLTNNVDLTVKTEDHLLPWEVFCRNVGSELLHSSIAIQRIAVQIVEKCGGHLLAIILMAKSLKDEKDVKNWELALKKLLYHNREATVNAFFNIIWANVISEREQHVVPEVSRLMRIWDFFHLVLSYPMRIGYEDSLRQWIYSAYHSRVLHSFADDDPNFPYLGWFKRFLYDQNPLTSRYTRGHNTRDDKWW